MFEKVLTPTLRNSLECTYRGKEQVIMDSPDFDRNRALEQQIELLTMKKEHLEGLITFA